jgi:PAT family beta-lactamase induction signal transducer AmpG
MSELAVATSRWTLDRNPRARYFTGALAYFAQGIPMGLLHIALPAWLASQGVGAPGIAAFLSIITLPWAFKLVMGPLMDHWEFLPMGKHRPWVLAAQLGMVLSLASLALLEDPAGQLSLLTALCFGINAFTATQDVAVDGMEIDFVPLEEEGRLNAFMSFGKAIGAAVAAAGTGTLLVLAGIQVTGIVCALAAALILLVLIMIRERDGERFLPWTRGEASDLDEPPLSWRKVFSEINHVLWLRASLVIMGIMFFDGLVSGYGRALMPIAAVQVFGFTTPQWADLNAVMNLVGAVLALGLGPLIDRHGAKRLLFLTTLLLGLHAFLLAWTQELWTNSGYVLAMMSAWIILQPVTMVCGLAIAMSIINHGASATQFAIYMSVGNLGAAIGSALYGWLSNFTNWSQNYALKGLLVFLLLLVILLFRTHDHPEEVLLPEES